MITKKTKNIIAILLIFFGAAAFVGLRSYVFSNLGATIQEKFQSLKISGFNVTYDSISIDWLKNVIEIEHIVLEKNAYDTSCIYPEFIAVNKIRAEGFRLIPLLFQSKLSFESVHLIKPHIVLREKSQLLVDSATKRANEFTLTIDKVFLISAHVEYTDSINCELITGFKSNLSLEQLKMDFHVNEPFLFTMDLLTLDSADIRLPKQFYTVQVKKTELNFLKSFLQLDTLKVIPEFGKMEFGKRVGYEIDRFEGVVPFVKLSGFSFSFVDSTVFRSNLADVQFYLKIFRDKRLPFKNKSKPLPIAQLQALPFTILIDTLKVTKSYVQYEEFGEEAKEPGGVFFDDLSAVIHNINNRAGEGETKLTAKASLMGQGDILLYANMPRDGGKQTHIEGSIKDFPITKINAMLLPTANIKVESGNMEKLSFKFAYNNVRSDGEIELNYTNLKLVTFKEDNKGSEKGNKAKEGLMQKDNLKTFILNTFIIRKNMNEKVPEEKRTGTVMFYRDDRKSIFNYWIKSLLSGIKSAYNLDKLEDKKNKRNEKKEERLTKKEARKQKRSEKKKERG